MLLRWSQFCRQYPRVVALATTLALVLIAVPASVPALRWRIHRFRHELAPLPLHQKNQGTLLQQEAFARANVLPLYGSSELKREQMHRASEFFYDAPTGFQVCPIGAAGNTSLLTLQKIASVGDVVRGHKLAFILSASWFMRPCTPADHYAGNFSALQAIRTLGNSSLSEALKRRIAQRLLNYPETLEAHPTLLIQARALVGQVPLPQLTLTATSGLLRIEEAGLDCEDAVQSVLNAGRIHQVAPWVETKHAIDWDGLLAKAKLAYEPSKRAFTPWPHPERPSPMDATRRAEFALAEQGEWIDFPLLLDTLKELGVQPLIIAMPLAGQREDLCGVRLETRKACYYDRIEALCRERGIAVSTMIEHDLDPDFLVDFVSHPSGPGWVQINRLLDDFWHGRFPTKT